jgi:hypothetical protein
MDLESAFLNTERGAAVFRVYEAAIAWAEDPGKKVEQALFDAVEESQGGESTPNQESK